jgi:tetratricopeptide (TPR) repeat protein
LAFDSLVRLKMAVGDTAPSLAAWPASREEILGALVHALPASNDLTLKLAQERNHAAPTDAAVEAELGRVLLERREYRDALTQLEASLTQRPRDADALYGAGLAHYALGEMDQARAFMLQARGVGEGDTTAVAAILAAIASQAGDDSTAATEALRALRGVRPTIRRPFPPALETVLRTLASRATAAVAAPVFEYAVTSRPSWDLAYWGGAQVHERGGSGGCRRAAELAEELPRFGWREDELVTLLRPCLAAPRN